MDEQVFVDGVGTISVIGGTVRLDLITYSPTEKDASGQPVAAFRQRLIMGMDAFLQVAGRMHEAAQTLTSRNGRAETAAPTSVVAPVATPVTAAPPPAVSSVPPQPVATIPRKPPFP